MAYSEGPAKVASYQEAYLRAILSFIGIVDVEAMGQEKAAMALANAEKRAYMIEAE